MKKRRYVVLAASLVILGLFALGLWSAQPLLPSTAYVATATLNGRPIEAELLSPPAVSGLYYVHLPEAQPLRYRWVGIAFSRQVVFSGPIYFGWGGFPYIHTDQVGGVRFTDSKIEDHWRVTFTADGVQFANSSLAVSLHRHP